MKADHLKEALLKKGHLKEALIKGELAGLNLLMVNKHIIKIAILVKNYSESLFAFKRKSCEIIFTAFLL